MKRLAGVLLCVFFALPLAASWSLSLYPGLNVWDNVLGWGGLVSLQYTRDGAGRGLILHGTTGFFSTGRDAFTYRNLFLGGGIGYRLPMGATSPFSVAGILTLGVGANHRADGAGQADWKASFTATASVALEYRVGRGVSLGLALVPLSVNNGTYNSLSLGTCLGASFRLGGGEKTAKPGQSLADDIRKTGLFKDRVETEGRKIRISLPDVSFAPGSFQVTERARTALEEMARRFREYKIQRVLIEGHTDNTGNDGINLLLSKRRAGTVAGIMIGGGLPAGGIIATGYGSSRPRFPNTTWAGRQKNRRVEITVEQ